MSESAPDAAMQVPLTQLLRSVPAEHRLWFESVWAESGAPIGHTHVPVGKYAHEAADRVEELERKLSESQAKCARLELELRVIVCDADYGAERDRLFAVIARKARSALRWPPT